MKPKNGFTLAEVLIAIAILGVVAAITLPTLTHNIQASQIGPSLRKSMNLLNGSNRLMLQQNDAMKLSSIAPPKEYLDRLSPYIGAKKSDYIDKYLNITRENAPFATNDADVQLYALEDGFGYIYNPNKDFISSASDEHKDDIYTTVYVDINGAQKKPNTLAIDTFMFVVLENGDVIPYGGLAWANITGKDTPLWKAGTCLSGEKPKTDYEESCTAAVLESGGNVKYKW